MTLSNILIVDPDPSTAALFIDHAEHLGLGRIIHQPDRCGALDALAEHTPDVILFEAVLPDGGCQEWLHVARTAKHAPAVLVMSDRADRSLIAELMADGADGYLEKPLTLSKIRTTLERLADEDEPWRRMARQLVGRIGLKEAQRHLRLGMHAEALQRTGGSRRAAASLLGVDRRYVQRLASAPR